MLRGLVQDDSTQCSTGRSVHHHSRRLVIKPSGSTFSTGIAVPADPCLPSYQAQADNRLGQNDPSSVWSVKPFDTPGYAQSQRSAVSAGQKMSSNWCPGSRTSESSARRPDVITSDLNLHDTTSRGSGVFIMSMCWVQSLLHTPSRSMKAFRCGPITGSTGGSRNKHSETSLSDTLRCKTNQSVSERQSRRARLTLSDISFLLQHRLKFSRSIRPTFVIQEGTNQAASISLL